MIALATAGTLLLGFTAAAPANDRSNATETAVQPDAAATKRVWEKKYCFIFETTGSRMQSKVCKTKAEWEAEGQEIEMK